ncbi:MAG: PIG-L deacetylase family protein [Micromonosporaceae bacterium]
MSEMTTPAPLEPLNEDWERALAIVAHPDDLEFGAAAAIARWTGQGKRIVYVLLTSGEAGIDGIPPEQCGPLREQEQRAAAAVVGVDEVEFAGFPDGVLEYGLPLRKAVARAVRRHRPEVVITSNVRDTWDDATALNQADHIATGRAVLDGVRDAGNRWVFTDLLAEGLEPWNKVREIWAANSPRARHGVDVTDTFDKGVASLRAHEQYLAGLGSGTFDPEEFLESVCRQAGSRLGCRYAVPFEVFPLQTF